MDDLESIYLKIKEGETKSYFNALEECFGGEVSGNVYEVNRGRTRIRLTSYSIIPGFEISTTSATHYTPVIIDRESDDNPDLIHLNVIKEGQLTRDYDSMEKRTEADSSKGIFIYNGLFPMRITHPPNALLESVSFKISKNALQVLLPEATTIFEALFGSNDPVAYHTHLPVELNTLVEDIFHFKKNEFGSKPLVIARSLELFTLMLRSIRKLVDKDELNGLHIDDYQRLLNIKDQLLSSFDQRVSVEGLASEFGISVSKLKRDFKTLFNTSVYQFYTHARMDEAYRRLRSGKYSVMEVGYDLGYQNLSKFSSMFKKVKGINPKDVMPV
ncbi:AraC family transcriptional regulator [uncultured Draconibacterium sp.]|uniref:helix-turn-helix domain-containing protein n=1 Tax=uncultured Draconibacterium sp. TaxID=1573823 RepID=UPI002AA8E0AE|nr:AraC family transcriptional regulator [uncultured Draconibacterium sp.]